MRYVYFAISSKTGLIKVGTSIYPIERLVALSIKEKAPVYLITAHECHMGLFSEEKRFHRLLGEFRVTGEWFAIGVPQVHAAIRTIRAENRILRKTRQA